MLLWTRILNMNKHFLLFSIQNHETTNNFMGIQTTNVFRILICSLVNVYIYHLANLFYFRLPNYRILLFSFQFPHRDESFNFDSTFKKL